MRFLYLHGFASGPDSVKGRFFADAFDRRGIPLERLDLNVGGFSGLTISGMLETIHETIARANSAQNEIVLIGSSLGGWTSLLYAQTDQRIKRLVLLAPAVGFDRLVRKRAGIAGMSKWKREGTMPIEHYQWKRTLPVHYELYLDAARHSRHPIDRVLPVQIFHGLNDDSVPYQQSIRLVEQNPMAELVLLPTDHGLNKSLPLIENQMFAWLSLP